MTRPCLILCLLWTVYAAPVSQLAPREMVDFMKQYGYLIDAGPDTDALYTEEAFKDAVKQMQKFGGIEETGIIDQETLKLMTSPRCGVKDVVSPSLPANKAKRYVIGADGWKKRKVTYFVANWPPELSQETVMEKTKKAFEVWSRISGLRFVHENSSSADIIVAFGQGAHGDGYPFDGPGNILAHAFFPYEHGSYGGDAHFDTGEVWKDGSKEKNDDPSVCCDYYTVAVHELGHSLGLAHSQVLGSVMFPYYKGYNPNFALDYDDIMAMYQMYIANGVFEEEIEVGTEAPTSFTTERTRSSHTFPNYPTTERTRSSHTFPDYPNYPTTERTRSSHTFPDYPNYPITERTTSSQTYTDYPRYPTTQSPKTDDKERVPDEETTTSNDDNEPKQPLKCNGSYDAISLIRNELFIFKGRYMWRLSDRGKVQSSYPVNFRWFLYKFPSSVQKIDAVYERKTDYKILFFTGKQYWVFDGSKFTDDSPLPLAHLGLPNHLESIDAAIVWGKNKKTYFFSGNYYWRYDERNAMMDEGYPHPIQKWRGIPAHLDSALTWRDGITYFFKGNSYWRFNNGDIMADDHFPQPASNHWLGCVDDAQNGCYDC